MFDTADLLSGYNLTQPAVACFGGRSALDISAGAKRAHLPTVVIAQEGRQLLYGKHFHTRARGDGSVGCVDDVFVVDEYADILEAARREELRKRSAILVHSKELWRRVPNYNRVEEEFNVPIFGSRSLLRLEGRNQPYMTRDLLVEAGIRMPQRFKSPDAIDRLAIVKVREDLRGYERAFFLAWDKASFEEEAERRIRMGQITQAELEKAVIEEYVIGALANFHFFFSPLRRELELIGVDVRRQTNVEGLRRMTPAQQKIALHHVTLQMVEIGHTAITVRESVLERAFAIAEEFISITQSLPREVDPTGKGMIGPFTLQGAIVAESGREDIVLFGVCFRHTTCPGIAATPYASYLYGMPMSMGDRIALEIRDAAQEGRLHEIVT